MTFDDWIKTQRRGTLARIREETGLGWTTLWRAQRGQPVSYRTARTLSIATGGAVPVALLCDPPTTMEARAA